MCCVHVVCATPTTHIHTPVNTQITHFNDIPINNLLHLIRLVNSCTDTYLRFTTDTLNKVIILNRETALAATDQVLQGNAIPARMSRDLQEALAGEEKGAASV